MTLHNQADPNSPHPRQLPPGIIILVRHEAGRLQFYPVEGGPTDTGRVRCGPDGDMTVTLDETPGYLEQITLEFDSGENASFVSFCSGEPEQCVSQGRIPGTPLSVEVYPHPGPSNGILLVDEYRDKSSLGTFNYRIYYETPEGMHHHDPQINNEGSSGGGGPFDRG